MFRLGSFSVSNNDTKTPPLDPLPGDPVPYFLQHRLQRQKELFQTPAFLNRPCGYILLISGQDTKKRLIRRAVYSFACLRLFLPCPRRGCVVRTGFAAMHTLYSRTRRRIRIVSTVFCLRCAYIFSNHSGHAWPYVGKVLHPKIDVYVRLPSAKTAQAHPNAYNHADSRAQSAVPVQRICTFLCVAHIIKRKHTAQAHSKRIQSRRLVNENAVSVQIICSSVRHAE